MLTAQPTLTFDKKLTKPLKIAIVRANYHTELINNLEACARLTLTNAGVHEKNIKTITVPGSWEIPIVVQRLAESKKLKPDGIITLGIIVKGETFHFELIANEVTSALMQLSIDNHIPIAYEVLAVSDIKHAQQRANMDTANKGIEAANAILQTALILKSLKK